MRILSSIEQERLRILTENSISVALIEPTATGIKKSIMDATAPVRLFLKSNEIHDYELQGQGEDNKVILPAWFVSTGKISKTKASLYRPVTKKGDPRIWFYNLGQYAVENDILALLIFEESVYVINLTQIQVEKLVGTTISNPVRDLINQINRVTNLIANELLLKLQQLAMRGFIPASVDADTAVGRTLETELGIPINSSKNPDYKGIELKSFRDKRRNRKNLFAQVADWDISTFKSSEEILNHFGYPRGRDFKLYCTVSTLKRNSQGLLLHIDNDHLLENSLDVGDFAVWRLEKLHSRLLEKHNETFWISAESHIESGREFFHYTKVEHTHKPIVTQFDILLEQGLITMDHLIKRDSVNHTVEKGPLFKIKSNSLNLLFPPSKIYNLVNN